MKNVLLFFGFLLVGCNASEDQWTSLFNGENLEGWHVYGAGDAFSGWNAEEGVLVFDPTLRTDPARSDLISDRKFTNFELSLEWKIYKYGNSGIFWGVVEEDHYEHAYDTGPEIQILDDDWTEYITQRGDVTRSGALYGMLAPNALVSNDTEAWNHYLLHVDHKENQGYLVFNDQEVLRFPVHGPEWDAMVANSGFADWPGFGKAETGHISLQEYGGQVAFRNIKIRVLPVGSE